MKIKPCCSNETWESLYEEHFKAKRVKLSKLKKFFETYNLKDEDKANKVLKWFEKQCKQCDEEKPKKYL